ncbi:MAG: sulfite exporter TauE/SafE family protein [Planctomycetales bacterium]|nr:sulfite exporter TauE/SafE family protein [Planctomycetales bacterium]
MASRRWLIVTASTIAVVWTLWLLLAPAPFQTMAKHWAVATTMIFGSLIAGATCEGGGAVAFPVFTKVLHVTPDNARWFALAIQSVGMTAASLTIFAMRRTLDWKALWRVGAGGALGMVVGIFFVAPLVRPPVVRVLFTMLQCGFATTLLISYRFKRDDVRGVTATLQESPATWILVLAGIAGGVVSSLFGNGLDLVAFSVLVLLFRVDERVATPTTVVLMASNSLVGVAIGLTTQSISRDVFEFWIAAAPIVVVGAPLGAIACRWLSRGAIVAMLTVLISVELLSTLVLIPMSPAMQAFAALTLAIFLAGYWLMSRCRRFWPKPSSRVEWADAP